MILSIDVQIPRPTITAMLGLNFKIEGYAAFLFGSSVLRSRHGHTMFVRDVTWSDGRKDSVWCTAAKVHDDIRAYHATLEARRTRSASEDARNWRP